jgi:hypothetical protein
MRICKVENTSAWCVNPDFDEGAIEDLLAKIKALALAESA